jgi:hypothetical protein
MDEHRPTGEQLAEAFLEGDPGGPRLAAGHEHPAEEDGLSSSVRTFEHAGHEVRIETTYRITIDGRPLPGHVEVLPDGSVHYHRFPQYAPPSAVAVVKTVIDTLWDKPEVADELAEVGPAEHGHDQGHHW